MQTRDAEYKNVGEPLSQEDKANSESAAIGLSYDPIIESHKPGVAAKVLCAGRFLARHLRNPKIAISLIVALSSVVNFLLVFQFSEYSHYLTSDMHGYWDRAMQVFRGDEHTLNTWATNAPYYPRVIAAIFTWLNLFQLNEYRLEVMLSINILLSALGTYSLYKIGNLLTGKAMVGVFIAGIYAFSYPNLYFNTFLLGEPFAIPIIIFSFWLLFALKDSYKFVALVGVVLAFAVGVRPSNGLMGLPFALYIGFSGFSFSNTPWRQWVPLLFPKFVRAGLFSLGFFLVVIGIVAENYRISHGKLAGITAHSGYNFFLGQTQAHKIESKFDGMHYIFVPASVAAHPENGTISTTTALYDAKAFFAMGWDYLQDHPYLWWDHLLDYDQLFFDNLFPGVPSVLGFETLYDPFRYFVFIMFLMCGLIYVPIKSKDIAVAGVSVFGATFLLMCASLYLFTVTNQYFQNFSYTVYVVFGLALWGCIKRFDEYKRFIFIYMAMIVLFTGVYQSYTLYHKHMFSENIRITAEVSNERVSRFNGTRNISHTETFNVNNLEFFQSEGLLHGTLGELDYKDDFYLTAETEMEVSKDALYEFTFYVDDGYEVYIDDQYLMGYNGLKKMDENRIHGSKYLTAGRHSLRVEYFEHRIFSGLIGFYRQAGQRHIYQTRASFGKLIGDSDKFTTFHLPPEGTYVQRAARNMGN